MLDGELEFFVLEDFVFYVVSMMKVFVMIEFFWQVEVGEKKFDDMMFVLMIFKSIIDGLFYEFIVDEDFDGQVYWLFGVQVSL